MCKLLTLHFMTTFIYKKIYHIVFRKKSFDSIAMQKN